MRAGAFEFATPCRVENILRKTVVFLRCAFLPMHANFLMVKAKGGSYRTASRSGSKQVGKGKGEMNTRKLILIGGLYAFVSLLSVGLAYSVAYAGNWNNNDFAYKAGDDQVYFHQCNLDSDGNTHRAFHNNNDHDILPTTINPRQYHGCETVDVRINGYAYGFDEGAYGWYECHDKHSPQVCDKGHVHINVSYGRIPEDYSDTLSLVCEEIGHSVGLGHRTGSATGSCMSQNWSSLHLDYHDKVDEINPHY